VGHSDFHGRDLAGLSPQTLPGTQALGRTVGDNVAACTRGTWQDREASRHTLFSQFSDALAESRADIACHSGSMAISFGLILAVRLTMRF
jgi:hypothetical protein